MKVQLIGCKYPNMIGLKIRKFKLSKIQKIVLVIMGVNLLIPFTFWPVTNPIIALIGIKLDKKRRVNFK